MVNSWCKVLSQLPQEVWMAYAKSRDPLAGRLSLQDYTPHYQAAHQCGLDLARRLRAEYGDASPWEMAEKMGVRVNKLPMPDGDGMLTFACYHEPDYIEVFTDNAVATESLIQQSGGYAYIGTVNICDMLLAHELCHVLLEQDKTLYPHKKHVRLWKLGKLERWSKLLSLEEVAAMAFAQELLQIPVSPYLYDVLMLLPQATAQAQKLYDNLLILSEECTRYG